MNKIAVLLASYNGEKYISELLASLEKQSHSAFDLYIRDDGSTDSTIRIIELFQSKSPLSVTLLPPGKNLGTSQSFASLLRYTLKKGPYQYFMFCDQDDIWFPEKIALTLETMHKMELSHPNRPLLVHTDLQVGNEKLDLLHPSYWSYQHIGPSYDSLNRLLIQNVITGCTMMINRPLAEIVTEIPKNAMMHDWWIGLAAAAFGKIEALPVSTIIYRQHSTNDTGAHAYSFATIIGKAMSLFSFSFSQYTRQAKSFLEIFGDRLDDKQRAMLEAFVSIEEQSWIKGKATLARHRFLKQHWIRNIGLFLCK